MSIIPPKNLKSGKTCWDCKHFSTKFTYGTMINGELTEVKCLDVPNCPAFGDEIPDEIYDYGNHDRPRPDLGQKNDIVAIMAVNNRLYG